MCDRGNENEPKFDAEKARRAFDFAAAAYLKKPATCLDNAAPTFNVIINMSYHCSWITNCFVYLAVSKIEMKIVIAFRGTDTWVQMCEAGVKSLFKKNCKGAGEVHPYFHKAAIKVPQEIKEKLRNLLKSDKKYEIWLTGHSLGGAIASIFGLLLRKEKVINDEQADRLYLYTFGSPRVGNYDFAQIHAFYLKNSFRIVYDSDPVPQIPPCNIWNPSRKCKGPFHKGHFYHHGIEVFYPYDMANLSAFNICHKNDDHKGCSKKVLRF